MRTAGISPVALVTVAGLIGPAPFFWAPPLWILTLMAPRVPRRHAYTKSPNNNVVLTITNGALTPEGSLSCTLGT
jgi:hypothetical protein